MIKCERMSNKTRSNQRPPKLVPQASAAFLSAYRPAKTEKKHPAAIPSTKAKKAPEKPENNPEKQSPAVKPASTPPRFSAPSPANAKPQENSPFVSNRNGNIQETNGSRVVKNPANRFSRPSTDRRDIPKPPAAPSQSQPEIKPQTEAKPEKKPEAPDASVKAAPNTPVLPSKGKSITDSSYSVPPVRTLPSNGANGVSGKNGASGTKTNGSHPVENGPSEKKGIEGQPSTPEKRLDLPENKPVQSLWSKDLIPVQIPMDPPSHLTFTNGNGKNNNGHTVKSDPGSRLPDIPFRLDNAGRGIDRVRLGLERLLKLHDDLPAQTAVLGVCDDGLPVLLDLNDPTSGSVLIIGDEREAQMDMLRTAAASMADRSTPSSVQFLVFSCDPEMWRAWIAERGFNRHCLAIIGAEDEDAVRDWIIRLADWTEQRLAGQRSGPPVLVVMDSLSFLPRLAYDVRLNFDWMAKEGPAARIWPLAAVSTELATALGTRMLRSFETRILGYAVDPAAYMRFGGMDQAEASQFGQAGTFAIRTVESWLRFHLPRLP